jgi:pimeloyl-ACP methyl ester carboxylesterase
VKKVLKIILICLGAIVLAAGIYLTVYFYNNMNYDKNVAKNLKNAGFAEKQATLPDGSVLNYGEGPNNGPALMLIHGQMITWEDYEPALPELSKRFHVFAVDCYGHGESSYDVKKYTANAMGQDFIWFMDNIIGEKSYVSGLSSGGIMTAWLAANAPDRVIGAVLEDPPYFSTTAERNPTAFAWVDSFSIIHAFLNQTEETNYTRYYLNHSRMEKIVGPAWQKMKDYAFDYMKKSPDKRLRIFYLPPTVNRLFDLTTGKYDLHFGDTFYDCSWFDGFDREAALSAIRCPTVLIHCSWYYSDDGILMGAMSGEDAQRVHTMIPGNKLIDVVSGHDFHSEKPREFTKILFDFLDETKGS